MLLGSEHLEIVSNPSIITDNINAQYFQADDQERLMNYGTMPPSDPVLDTPPKYEECEELPPQYDAATMRPSCQSEARLPSYREFCPLSFDNKGYHH